MPRTTIRLLGTASLVLLANAFPALPAAGGGDRGPLGPAHVEWMAAPTGPACVPPPWSTPPAQPSRADVRGPTPLARGAAQAYPQYAWPLARHLHDGLLIINYVDLDPTPGLLDYSGGTHTYDGHLGIDYGLYNFRLMDRGCAVRAASPGTVAYMSAPSPYDRHCDFNWPDDGNWIWVDNGDGTYSEYYHLRANSVTVQVGDAVQTGQTLGLVGSSGYSTAPHLHFETGDYFGGPYQARDPYHGPSNPPPSLWNVQDDYEGDDRLWFADLGVFSEAEVSGSVFNTSYCDIQERLQQPLVYGIGEANLPIWVQFQGRAGDPGRIEVRRPNGTLFSAYDFSLSQNARFDWMWIYWFWSPNVSAADYGTWTVRVLSNGVLSNSTTFQVGPATVFGPRFWRRSGRSFRINGAVQRDTLRHSPLGGPVSYSLLNAPSFVSLIQDSILVIGATSDQPNRSLYFQALMTDGAARRDTAWFHIVDMSKAVGPAVDAGPMVLPQGVEMALAGPSPFGEETALRYRLDAPARVWLAIYDLRGRMVRALVDGEEARAGESYTRRWDGRDRAGVALPGGIYFARMRAGDARRVLKIARMP
jgi:murein DD-endopeptidase MepM/ murein hydrolase activator NlpD